MKEKTQRTASYVIQVLVAILTALAGVFTGCNII